MSLPYATHEVGSNLADSVCITDGQDMVNHTEGRVMGMTSQFVDILTCLSNEKADHKAHTYNGNAVRSICSSDSGEECSGEDIPYRGI